ncbi:unnamed protein product, partial [marine sediment metagenome]
SDFEVETAKVEVPPLEAPPSLWASILAFIGGTVLIIWSRSKRR